jgi:hypothetical protein
VAKKRSGPSQRRYDEALRHANEDKEACGPIPKNPPEKKDEPKDGGEAKDKNDNEPQPPAP